MNNSFLHTQEKLYREAADLLASYIQQAENMRLAEKNGFPVTAAKIDKRLTRISADLEAIRTRLFLENKNGISYARKDVVTHAEQFDWHPHENMQ